jgi:hypothetical protein
MAYRPYSTYNYNARVSNYRGYNYGPIAGTVATPPTACCGKPVRSCDCSKR